MIRSNPEWMFRVKSKTCRIYKDVSLHTEVESRMNMIPFRLCLNKNLYIILPACVLRETDKDSLTVTVLYRCVIYLDFFSRLHPNVLGFTVMQMEGEKFLWNGGMFRFYCTSLNHTRLIPAVKYELLEGPLISPGLHYLHHTQNVL